MRFSSAVLAAGLAPLALAHPLEKRQNALPTAKSVADENVLQLANYLENLEFALYSGGYEKFTDAQYTAAGFPAGFRENVGVIAQHEATHAATLGTILTDSGYKAVPPCTYNFPYTDPVSFVDLANMITSVGIGAYLGGASQITDNPTLETASGTILTVEARHDAYLRAGVGGSPFPTAFDTALTSVFAYNLAQMFIVKCPMQLPITILPKLTLAAPAPSPHLTPVAAGTQLTFKYDPSTFFVKVDPKAPLYIAFINQVTNTTFVQTKSCGTGCANVALPAGLGSAVFAVLTTFSGGLNEDQVTQFGTLAGPAEIIAS
ncbi:MAG: hypothetical protein Q9191_001667 [Dirinaria sp. TL-2023a]